MYERNGIWFYLYYCFDFMYVGYIAVFHNEIECDSTFFCSNCKYAVGAFYHVARSGTIKGKDIIIAIIASI